jgi:hypothetical protein
MKKRREEKMEDERRNCLPTAITTIILTPRSQNAHNLQGTCGINGEDYFCSSPIVLICHPYLGHGGTFPIQFERYHCLDRFVKSNTSTLLFRTE